MSESRKRKTFYRKVTPDDEPMIREAMKRFTPLYVIAQKIGCCRTTLSNYVKKHMADALEDMDDGLIDMAENQVVNAINNGDIKACFWFLEHRGARRGYCTASRQTVEVEGLREASPKEIKDEINRILGREE